MTDEMNDKTENKVKIDLIMDRLMDNADLMISFLDVLDRMKSAGIINVMKDTAKDYMPTDIEFLGKFLTSKEFVLGMIKSANTLLGFMHALSSEKTSDFIKLLMFNAEGATDAIVDGFNNPEKLTLRKMFTLMKEPEYAGGLTALLNLTAFMGRTAGKLENE